MISDKTWAEIIAIRSPRVSEATARAELERALAEYQGFVRDPKKLKLARERQRHVIKIARDLETLLPPSEADVVAAFVRARAERRLVGLDFLVGARANRRDPEREFLLGRLFDVWVDSFGGTLTVTDRPGRGPTGLLIRFILATTRDVKPITPNLIRNAARRERERRERLLQTYENLKGVWHAKK